MIEPEVFRICPQCGSREVPKLIVRSARVDRFGSSWQCHSCSFVWSDSDQNSRWAS